MRIPLWIALLITWLSNPVLAQTEPDSAVYIHAGRLLSDPQTGRVETAKTIVVRGGRVVEILDGYQAGGNVIDLRDSFVLPGLVDSHVHLTFQSGSTDRLDLVTQSEADIALGSIAYASRTLRAGFTTVMDLASREPRAVYALRDAIAAGRIEGPRIVASGVVGADGGHSDIHGYRAEIEALFRSPTLCSGADDCTRAVRVAVQRGADVIKVISTGGILSDTAAGLGQQMTDAELAAIVGTAHRLDRKVAAHAHGADGINAALRAGVDSIEHGTYLDAASLKLFKANGSYLVPTLLVGDTVMRQAEKNAQMPRAVREKALKAGPLMIDALGRAYRADVNIAFGTDSGISPHGDNAREFALMVKAGLTPLDAIRSATVWGARHVGLENEIGTLRPGKAADIVAVKGDPLTDIELLEHVNFVMKGGVAVKNIE